MTFNKLYFIITQCKKLLTAFFLISLPVAADRRNNSALISQPELLLTMLTAARAKHSQVYDDVAADFREYGPELSMKMRTTVTARTFDFLKTKPGTVHTILISRGDTRRRVRKHCGGVCFIQRLR